MAKRNPRTFMYFFSVILKTNVRNVIKFVFFFNFRGECVPNYHMVRGNCQGKKMKHIFWKRKAVHEYVYIVIFRIFIFSLPFRILWDKLFV